MTDEYVEKAQEKMGAVERLVKGLPGIRSYVDKELRRAADRRLRTIIASQLVEQKDVLVDIQERMLQSGGLRGLDRVERLVQNLQTLIDRVKTASQGYAGLFDAVRIQEAQLAALHRFDVALAERVTILANALQELAAAVRAEKATVEPLARAAAQIDALNTLIQRRDQAVIDPDLLLDTGYAPDVNEQLMAIEPGTAAE